MQYLSPIARSLLITLCLTGLLAHADPPLALDPNLKIELFAEAPDIVTPVGATFDAKGRLLVIESHTHKRARTYEGPLSDRVRIVEDTDGDGRADSFRTFYEGAEFAMSLTTGPDGWIYLATRAKIVRIRDTDGDDQADEEQLLSHLETEGDYPHNGLSGLTLDGQGHLYFGMGENLGSDYRLIGSDKKSQRGSGEGGIFRCDLDGKNLKRIATGFWNPFGICIDSHQRMFAVGNDSDGRPPCRLVQVLEAGDYGFQFRYGRGGRHPLQAWDGELPGTLPMVAGTGEAPCEMVVYGGKLWVASWGDNQIETYELVPKGASFSAKREIVIRGDKRFRPVALTKAPDGSLFITDWVDRSYPVHGSGAIWRLSYNDKSKTNQTLPAPNETEARARTSMTEQNLNVLGSDDPFERQYGVINLLSANPENIPINTLANPRWKLGLLQALRWKMDHSQSERLPPPVKTLSQALQSSNEVRLYAVRWIGDANIKELRDEVAELLTQKEGQKDLTRPLFLAILACLEILDNDNLEFEPQHLGPRLIDVLADETAPAKIKVEALRLLQISAEPTPELLDELITNTDPAVRREAVRWLGLSEHDSREVLLTKIAEDSSLPNPLREDAKLGVNQFYTMRKNQNHPERTLDEWMQAVGEDGDVDAGWRVFFRAGNGRCASCHTYQGRGAKVGPNLTGIAAKTSRREVFQSILFPNRDVAPKYVPHIIVTKEGRVLQGLHEGRDSYVAPNGGRFEIKQDAIESHEMSKISIMPEGLHEELSIDDIRNLLALLETP